MTTDTTIQCPQCGADINVNEALYAQFKDKVDHEHIIKKHELENKEKEQDKKYKEALAALNTKEQSINAIEEQFDEKLKIATEENIKTEKILIYNKIKIELEKEQSESNALLEKELADKSEKIKELNVSKVEIEKLKREKNELASAAKLEAQKELNEELKLEKNKLAKIAGEERDRVMKELQDSSELKLKEKDEQIEQMKRDIENARRKAEQGSMQVQGEALEVTIENWLTSQFAFDQIEEVKKGAFGADCIQRIHTREFQNCGAICYESKNTKAWSDGWITKLKQDMLTANANIGVLVTSVYPREMKRMGFIDGVWVCSLEEFKGSASLLRESLIRMYQTSKSEENKGDKMQLLYSYMTGNEFSMQMNSIVDGFIKMQDDLNKEKRSLMASWKRRQKTIDSVLANTTEMYGALQGIAGASAIKTIEALELESPDEAVPKLE